MKIDNIKTGNGGRFEAREDERFAGKIEYSTRDENKIVIEHTEVDSAFQGKGVGKDLVHEAAEYARENNLKIIPVCSYAKKFLERTSDYDDVLT